jgi:hypothetical protein
VAWDCYESRRLPDSYPIATDYSWGDAYVPSTRHHFRVAGRYSPVPTIGAGSIFVWAGADQSSTLVGAGPASRRDLPPVDLSPPGPPEVTRGPRPPVSVAPHLASLAYEDIGDHIGRVEAWVDNAGNQRSDECVVEQWDRTVITLEGNADDDLVRKRRPMSLIDGFCHPLYPTPVPPEEEDPMAKATALHTLYDHGGGVFVLLASGPPPVLLTVESAVRGFLDGEALLLGTLDDEQHKAFGGKVAKLTASPDLVQLLADARATK